MGSNARRGNGRWTLIERPKCSRRRARALQRQARNIDAERECCLIRLGTERKVGQLLREMAERGERDRGHGDRKSGSQAATPTLDDLASARRNRRAGKAVRDAA
jgi:hypothetical protein